jgi:hypothetical protein
MIDAATNTVHSAFEWSSDDVKQHGRRSDHTNGYIVRGGQLPVAGTEVTERIQGAWALMLDLVETADTE